MKKYIYGKGNAHFRFTKEPSWLRNNALPILHPDVAWSLSAGQWGRTPHAALPAPPSCEPLPNTSKPWLCLWGLLFLHPRFSIF